MKILLAEDSKTMMLTTTAIIRQSGHDVIQARNGIEALSLYQSESPDLVLLDVEMPELNGFEVAEKIRSKDKEPWIPIIFLTSYEDDEHLSQAINAGGDDYLIKPVSDIVLNAKLSAMYRISEIQNKLRSTTNELSNTNKKLRESVITDPLTGAKNRLYLDESSQREWYRSMRNKKELSLLIVDIDNFKTLNDSNGHYAGDKCLIEFVKLFKSHMKRSTDVLCRFGGDEFVILLPDTSSSNAMKIAEKIRINVEEFSAQFEMKTSVDISVSIGCASCIPNKSFSFEGLLKHADKALYVSKESGRNCVTNAEISIDNSKAA
jgi:diguanylate cyclase (GGDEF)-like protein